MKGLNLAALILATSFVGYSSCGVIETIVTTLFADCDEVKSFLKLTYGKLDNTTREPSPDNITIWVYGNSTLNKIGTPLNNSGNLLWNDFGGFNKSLPTEFVIHGFTQNSESPGINAILNAFIKKGGRNVIFVDANLYTRLPYLYAATATKFIGELLARELASLVNNGYNKSNIHLIGFSLGANIAGVTGNTFKNITSQTLPWITGLDPAGPCFFETRTEDRLEKSDADFVDVIHTNGGIFGTNVQIGHVDFYPNGGEWQPGTILQADSHSRAYQLYPESILDESAYVSATCKNYVHFLAGACSRNSRTNMGYGVSKTATGRYYLRTNGASAYNKGDAGIPSFNFYEWFKSLFC